MSEKTISAEKALFEGQFQSLVVTCYENERPLCGLAGIIDWHFHGALSQYIVSGAVTGQVGEMVYFPLVKSAITFHILLLGAGRSISPGHRESLTPSSLHDLQKNLVSLKLTKVGLSKSDFGQASSEHLTKHLKGVSLWIGP
jgi:hypothetical protein